jgi:hypothetical protein
MSKPLQRPAAAAVLLLVAPALAADDKPAQPNAEQTITFTIVDVYTILLGMG